MQIVAALALGLSATPQGSVPAIQANTTLNPGFTLRLSRGRIPGEFPKGTQMLIVHMTNTSKEVIREDACSTGGKLYKLITFYNGVQQQEPEWRRKPREAAEAGETQGGDCPGVSNPAREIDPGDYVEDFIFYPAAKPGTYEFTVEEKIYSLNSQSAVVRSNTLTIVVPPAPN